MTIIDHKNIKLSAKVQQILFKKGYSHIFNWEDYKYYKKLAKDSFFPAEKIASLFIENTCEFSDYAEYEY